MTIELWLQIGIVIGWYGYLIYKNSTITEYVSYMLAFYFAKFLSDNHYTIGQCILNFYRSF